MRVFLCVVLITASLSFAKCTPDKTAAVADIALDFQKITLDTNIINKKISTIGNQIDYIPLETTEEIRIGKVDKMEYFQEKIFVLDKHSSKAFYVFDKTGKLLYQKKVKSGGLNRISSFSDFSIDRNKGKVYLYSIDQKEVLAFQINDGAYIRSFRIKGYFSNMAVIDSNFFLLMRDGVSNYDDEYGEYRLCQFDSTGKLLRKWINNSINPNINAGGFIYGNNSFNNEVILWRMFSDTVYNMANSNLQAIYKINAQKEMLPYELRTTKNPNIFRSFMENISSSYVTSQLFNTKKMMSFYFKLNQFTCLYMYDKIVDRGEMVRGIDNDIDHTMLPLFIYMDDFCVVSVIDAPTLLHQHNLMSNTVDYKSKFSTLIQLNARIDQDSNPVLAFIKLK